MKMHHLLAFLYVLFFSSQAYSQNYKFDGPNVVLSGTIYEETADASTTIDGKAVRFPALKLSPAINIDGSEDDADAPSEREVSSIQLALDGTDAAWKTYKDNIGRHVSVECQLYHRMNAHHYTAALCTVKKISKFIPGKASAKIEIRDGGYYNLTTSESLGCSDPKITAQINYAAEHPGTKSDESFFRLAQLGSCGVVSSKIPLRVISHYASDNSLIDVVLVGMSAQGREEKFYVVTKYLAPKK